MATKTLARGMGTFFKDCGNPRPTHYEIVSVRVAWCLNVLLSDVLPDQIM
ncbi:hypothetical protein ACFV0C_28065 [Streptomyces sp. NPDC059568]